MDLSKVIPKETSYGKRPRSPFRVEQRWWCYHCRLEKRSSPGKIKYFHDLFGRSDLTRVRADRPVVQNLFGDDREVVAANRKVAQAARQSQPLHEFCDGR